MVANPDIVPGGGTGCYCAKSYRQARRDLPKPGVHKNVKHCASDEREGRADTIRKRTRLMVTKRIKDVVARIRPGEAELARHLATLGSIVHNQEVDTEDDLHTIVSGLTQVPLFDNGSGAPVNLVYLQALCGALVGNGTGGGICRCQVPDPDALPSPHITATATIS